MTEFARADAAVAELVRQLREDDPPPSVAEIRATLRIAEHAGLFGSVLVILSLARQREIDVWT